MAAGSVLAGRPVMDHVNSGRVRQYSPVFAHKSRSVVNQRRIDSKSQISASPSEFELNRPIRTWGALKRRRDSISSSMLRFWKAGHSAPAQDLVRLTTPGRALSARLSLSHSRRPRASWRQIGRLQAGSFVGARSVREIRSLVMDCDKNRLMMNTMTGLRFGGESVGSAAGLSLSCRCFLFHTRITA